MEHVECPICKRDQTRPLFVKWGFAVVQCANCGLVYVNPRQFQVEADDYFKGPYLSAIERDGVLDPGIRTLYSDILSRLGSYLRPGRLLDVGCAMGHFMVEARNAGWQVHGVECSQFAAQYGRQRWDLRIQSACTLDDVALPPSHFDACVLIEVAEHLPVPLRAFEQVLRFLKPGGVVIVTTPNFASYRSLLMREQWAAVIPSGHLYYFTARSLTDLLTAAGFERCIDLTRPAVLDEEIRALAGGGGSLDSKLVEEVRASTEREDRDRLCNGRGEGLVLCAQKPRRSEDVLRASLRVDREIPSLEGRLVRVPGTSPEDQRVFLVKGGRKHWVVNPGWLKKAGMRLDSTIEIDRDLLGAFWDGPPLS